MHSESIQCNTNESIQNKSESVHYGADESIQYGTESILLVRMNRFISVMNRFILTMENRFSLVLNRFISTTVNRFGFVLNRFISIALNRFTLYESIQWGIKGKLRLLNLTTLFLKLRYILICLSLICHTDFEKKALVCHFLIQGFNLNTIVIIYIRGAIL